jgi:hypothetical protein
MKVFLLIYNEINGSNLGANLTLFSFLEQNKFEWWKYAQDNMFIATPDSYDTEILEKMLIKLFPTAITAVIEVDVKKWSGRGPVQTYKGNPVSFLFWFEKISNPNYIPAWLRKDDDVEIYQKPSKRMHFTEVPHKKEHNIMGQSSGKKDE